MTPAAALAAVVDGALGKGRALAEVATHAKGGEGAAYLVGRAAGEVQDCPAKRDTMRAALQADWTAKVLRVAGLAGVVAEGGEVVGAGQAVDIGEAQRVEAVRAFLDTHRDSLEAAGFSLPQVGCAPHLIRSWLINRLGGLGVEVERTGRNGGRQRRGKHRPYYVTPAAVAAAWTWAQRPFLDLVGAAEADAAGWQGCHLADVHS